MVYAQEYHEKTSMSYDTLYGIKNELPLAMQ